MSLVKILKMLEQPLFHTIDGLGETKHGLKPTVHVDCCRAAAGVSISQPARPRRASRLLRPPCFLCRGPPSPLSPALQRDMSSPCQYQPIVIKGSVIRILPARRLTCWLSLEHALPLIPADLLPMCLGRLRELGPAVDRRHMCSRRHLRLPQLGPAREESG